jgi:acetyl-CoA/propionyl-CoA carboxylase, biotin carboxylase, biotin carboxyl carrier protein
MFSKVLIANRGEIAVRVARTCRELGVATVALYSDPDAGARHVRVADESVHLPGSSPTDTYLNLEAVIDAARRTGAEAVHPGYGFLSERADAAEAVSDAGLVWIGPPSDAIRAAGDKVMARRLAESAGVAPVPGTLEPVSGAGEVLAFGERFGYPVAIKAAGGGGGRGLKVAGSAEEVEGALEAAIREAVAYFGYGDVYLERYLPRPKHVEIQVLAPEPGGAMWLGARDCSLQRRHQKLVEETPPARYGAIVPAMGDAAVAVSNACGYANAGTVEFLVDLDATAPAPDGAPGEGEVAPFYFLEINARLQVEHTVTEEILGVDLVAAQLWIAAGEPLGFDADDVRPGGRLAPRGHAIECRINAEDPSRGFLPGPGRIERYREPGGPGIRVDSGFGEGDTIPAAYDSLIAKLVAWGGDREEARRRMLRALEEFEIAGVPTTIPAHRLLLEDPEFVAGGYSTRTVEGGALDPLMGQTVAPTTDMPAEPVLVVHGTPVRLWHPAVAGSVSAATGGAAAGAGQVVSPMHGTILEVKVSAGDEVRAGEAVAVLEAMKMETAIVAAASGTVRDVLVGPGEVVEAGQPVAAIG